MAQVLAAVMNGLRSIVRALWGLQERRFFATFDAVMSAAVSLTTALVVCLLSSTNGLRAEVAVAYI
ncbi:hypothetical protein SLEP1_g8322 [Rubroshorea leprosula]|uniref:CASP-like protein n=1 Tax=Rubroshorea leprosula TaxID=152421 RepID=A0AAV5I1A1_9ROSI|nr:hypothetical protein SLEP1_g8322 [Rubroshorea leprosula]